MIAMAMALNPSLLIADEPTTALDVTVQAQILAVLADLQRNFAMAIILITHDLGVIAEVADEVVVMYAGSMMERASRRELFYDARHPYTIGLLQSLPSYDELAASGELPNDTPGPGAAEWESSSQSGELATETTTGSDEAVDPFARRHLYSIPGQPPSLLGLAGGCPFTPRCIFRMERCPRERPPLFTVAREPIVAITGRSARLHSEPKVDATGTDGSLDPSSDDNEDRPHISACWLEAVDERVSAEGASRATGRRRDVANRSDNQTTEPT